MVESQLATMEELTNRASAAGASTSKPGADASADANAGLSAAFFLESAENPPRRYPLVVNPERGGVLVGRNSAHCDIVVEDNSSREAKLNVSRVHARIDVPQPLASELLLVDENSMNGLFVNGVSLPCQHCFRSL